MPGAAAIPIELPAALSEELPASALASGLGESTVDLGAMMLQRLRLVQQLDNPVAVAVRNTVMRLTPPRLALRSMARYADWCPPPLNLTGGCEHDCEQDSVGGGARQLAPQQSEDDDVAP